MEENIKKLEQIQFLNKYDLYSYVEKSLETGSLESLIDLLELAVYVNHQRNEFNTILDTACYDFVLDFTLSYTDFNFSPFTHVQSTNSLSFFIAKYIYLTLNCSDCIIDNISKTNIILDYNFILNYIKGYQKTTEKQLSNETIQELIEIYLDYDQEQKASYNQYGNPLTILTIDFSNSIMASMYHPRSHTILLNTIDNELRVYSEYVLMHELGHALQLKATGNPSKVPDDFKNEIIPYMFPTVERQDEITEIFADCLAAVLMKNTKFESKNETCGFIKDSDMKLLDNYFKRLILEI